MAGSRLPDARLSSLVMAPDQQRNHRVGHREPPVGPVFAGPTSAPTHRYPWRRPDRLGVDVNFDHRAIEQRDGRSWVKALAQAASSKQPGPASRTATSNFVGAQQFAEARNGLAAELDHLTIQPVTRGVGCHRPMGASRCRNNLPLERTRTSAYMAITISVLGGPRTGWVKTRQFSQRRVAPVDSAQTASKGRSRHGRGACGAPDSGA